MRLAETPELAARPKGSNFVQLPQDSCGSSLALRCWEVVTTSAMLIHIVQHFVQSLGLQTPGAMLASRKRYGISQRTLGPRISGWASESGRGTRTPPGHRPYWMPLPAVLWLTPQSGGPLSWPHLKAACLSTTLTRNILREALSFS